MPDPFKDAEISKEDDSVTFEKELLPVRIGTKDRPALALETVREHFDRRNYDTRLEPNGFAKDITGFTDNKTLGISIYQNGKTEMEFTMDFESLPENPEKYVKPVVDDILGEILTREQKVYKAATNYVNNVLPKEAEERGLTEIEVLKFELGETGATVPDIVEGYVDGGQKPTDLLSQYSMQFEAWPHQDADGARSERGRMPIGDTVKNTDLESRHSNYLSRYLVSVIEEALDKYGGDEELEEKWLESAAAGI